MDMDRFFNIPTKNASRKTILRRIKEMCTGGYVVDTLYCNNIYGPPNKLDHRTERIAPLSKNGKKWFYRATNRRGKYIHYIEFYPNRLKLVTN